MRRLTPAVLLLAAFASGSAGYATPAADPAVSQTRASVGAQDQVVDTASGEKVICRSDKEVGSRVRAKRVCMTTKQWAQKTAEERQFLEQRQAQRTVAGN